MMKKVIILTKYLDFINIFLKKLAKVLLKQTNINKYTIDLVDNKEPLYPPIYNLSLVKFKNIEIYIKTYLANNFI